LILNGKLDLYARKDCTDQLRKIHKINITTVTHKQIGDLFVVTAVASDPSGRSDSSTGAVSIQGLRGDALANAMMRAETKAKRRVTLSLCGLGMVDESEVESIADASFPPPELDKTYIPTMEQDVEDADIVRNADERIWKRYLELLDKAQGLGINLPQVRLPIAREELKIRGGELHEAITEREEQLMQEDAARSEGRTV
jgi:hypothetical protein